MARAITSKIRVSGVLKARTALHVGGYGEDPDTDLPLARDGQGRLVIPGTSLAGALRAWCEYAFGQSRADVLWGPRQSRGQDGHASFVIVDDAGVTLPTGAWVEIRDGVGIDRVLGVAAKHIKYDRAVLPRGTRLRLELTVELQNKEDRLHRAMLGHLLEALKKGRIRLGAARTRGLGRVLLSDLDIVEQVMNTRAGVITALKGKGRRHTVGALAKAAKLKVKSPPRLALSVAWRADGPVMVKADQDGIAVDTVPLFGGHDGEMSMLLPGSAIKGALRAQAERIVRTLLERDASRNPNARQRFLDQLDVPLVVDLFGSRGQADSPRERVHPGPLPGLGALRVDDCHSTSSITVAKWREMLAARSDRELRDCLDNSPDLRGFSKAIHVAIDRWTGGAADRFLYSVLEPRSVDWEPIELEVDLSRLPVERREASVALLLMVLSDLGQGRIPLGFGTYRGMGSVEIDQVNIAGEGLQKPLSGLRNNSLPGGQLGGLAEELVSELDAAWTRWVERERQAGAS